MSPAPAAILCAGIAAVFLALPLRAQEAGDDAAGQPEATADTAAEAPEQGKPEAPPENAGAEPAPEGTAAGAAAQAPNTAGEAAEGAAGGEVVVDIEEGSVLDDQTFEGEDDDFIPSEEIPIDQPIPFPTDI